MFVFPQSIHLFTTVQTQESAIDYHVSLAQNAMQTCLDHPELQNEIYCQLIKQTSKHVHRGPEDLGVCIFFFLPNSSHLVSLLSKEQPCSQGLSFRFLK